MIIDEEVEVKTNNSNYKYFLNLGYTFKKIGDYIKIKVDHLSKGSHYYDGKYIKENLLLDKNDNLYPSIDHKIPVLYGFLNNISKEEISNINNLCITKRITNSKKGITII